MKLLHLEACPCCGATAHSELTLYAQRLRRCATCDTLYTVTYADPSEVYTPEYFKGSTEFGIDLTHPRFQAYLRRVATERIDLIRALTRGARSLLDVGAGTGDVAVAALEEGLEVVAVEPEREAAQAAAGRGVDVRPTPLADAGLTRGSYEAVSAFHVLEHQPDSRAFLRELAVYARPGGHVIVEVPNYASVLRRRSGAGWIHLRPLEHLVYYTATTLRKAMVNAGLEPVAVRTPSWIGPPQQLDEALNDLGRPRIRRVLAPLSPERMVEGGSARVPSRPAWSALRLISRAYERERAGMVCFGVARVPREVPAP